MIWNVGTFPSRRVFKSYLIVSSSSPGSSIRHFSLEGKMRKRLIRVKTVEWSTIQAFICSHRYLLQPDRGKKERKKPTGDVTVISGTPDLLLVHSHTHTLSQSQSTANMCESVSLSVHLCDLFFSPVFILFSPCIYFGASWFIRAVGANNAKVTGSSPGLAMSIFIGPGWKRFRKDFVSSSNPGCWKKDQFMVLQAAPILSAESACSGLLTHSTSASVAHSGIHL